MTKFFRSFRHAVDGIRTAIATERNFRFELVLAVASVVLALILPLSVAERAIVFLTIGIILSLELLNTAFEHLMDVLNPQYHEDVKKSKDIAAGAVLLASIAAATVGLVVFVPHIIPFVSKW
jgi:diacylglycerol kinase